jgi:ligand-binding sensor domain-containing protein/signal transduction histidine kinase
MSRIRTALRSAMIATMLVAACALGLGAELDLPPSRAGLNGVDTPHRSVYAILEDSDGFLWFGTLDGLGRYDGYEMVVYRHDPSDPGTLSHNAVHVLLEDRSGRLWIGTENGLDSLDRRRSEVRRHQVASLNGDGGLIVTSAFEDRRGRLWFGTSRGLLMTRPDSAGFHSYPGGNDNVRGLAQPTVIGIAEDAIGVLWVATASENELTLHRFDESRSVFQRIEVLRARDWPLTFAIDRSNRGWFHPTGSIDLVSDRSADARRSIASGCTTARAIVESADGALWFGCADGLHRLEPNASETLRVPLVPGDTAYLEDFVRALTFDRSGTLWVGTQAGILRIDPAAQPFLHLTNDPDRPDSLSSSSISAIAEGPDGRLWVGTFGGGLNRMDPGFESATRYCSDPGAPHRCPGEVVWDLHIDGAGTLWIAGKYLWSLDTATDRVSLHLGGGELSDDGLAYVVEGPAANLWLAGFDRRLYRYQPTTRAVTRIDVSGEPSLEFVDPRIDVLEFVDDELWLATGSWLGRYDPATGELERIPIVSASGDHLGSQGTWAFHPGRDGRIWLGTSSGLVVFDPDREIFTVWTTHDGLPGSTVYSILGDADGRLWLGTNQGLSCFDPNGPNGAQFRTFTTADGIGNIEFNRHAAIATSEGRFVFGGMDGLTVFVPSRIDDNPFVPPIRITALEVWSRDGKRSVNPFDLGRLELDHRDSTFGFTFTALSFTDPSRNRFSYRLDGFDDDWIEAGTRRSCQYTNIPPGRYVFRVQGSNNDGVWNEEGVSLPVLVRPASWQTWWFRLLTIAVVGAAVAGAVTYRRARQRELQRLRLRIADDLHDDLSSDLSGIAVVTDMIQRKESIEDDDRRDLAAARDVALKMVDGVRDIVWYIDPEHDNLGSTIVRMRHVAEVLLGDVEHVFDVRLADGATPLPMTVRRNLLMVFKESLHNIVRHAGATEVRIEVAAETDRLRLLVEDNGIGFDPDLGRSDGHGLRSMRRRSREIDAELDISSESGAGTTIAMTVDFTRSRDGRAAERRPRLKGGNRGARS